jgi:hypothetical protein
MTPLDGLALLVLILAVAGVLAVIRLQADAGAQVRDSEGHEIDPAELEGDEPEELKQLPTRRPRSIPAVVRSWVNGGWWPWWWGR